LGGQSGEETGKKAANCVILHLSVSVSAPESVSLAVSVSLLLENSIEWGWNRGRKEEGGCGWSGTLLKRKPRLNTNKALSAKALRRIIQIASIGERRGIPDDWVGGPFPAHPPLATYSNGWLEVCLGAPDCHVAATLIQRQSR